MKRLLAIAALAFVVLVAGSAAADTFAVTIVSQTSSTITLGWTPQPGYGYLFSADGVLVSRTNDPSRSQVKFSKNSANSYDIDVIVKGANGHCCTTPPPPPPAGNVVEFIGTVPASEFLQRVNSAPAGALTVRPVAGQATFTVNGDVSEFTRANVTIQRAVFRSELLVNASADNLTIEDSKLQFFYLRQGGVANFTLQRSLVDGENVHNQNWMYDASNFRFLNNTFVRFNDTSDPNNHSEAIFVAAGNKDGLIQGNVFDNNGRTGHLFFSWWGGSEANSTTWPTRICVKGNTFRNTNGAYDIQYRQEFPASWPLYIEAPPSNTWSTVNGGSSFPTKACP